MIDFTIKETEDQEEPDRENYRPMLNVDHLDSDKGRCREHDSRYGKAGRAVRSAALVRTIRSLTRRHW